MNGRIIFNIVLALVVIAALVGLGVTVYNAGVAQGLAASGKLADALVFFSWKGINVVRGWVIPAKS